MPKKRPPTEITASSAQVPLLPSLFGTVEVAGVDPMPTAMRVSGGVPVPADADPGRALARPRQFGDSIIAMLFGRSAGHCASPSCRRPLVLPPSGTDPAVIVGERAHIFAFSDRGPRPNPSLTSEERNAYENLILLCGHCHATVDRQPDSHPVALLQSWKLQHETWVETCLRQAGSDIGAATLEVVCAALLDTAPPSDADLSLTPIREKMSKNGLSDRTGRILLLGSLQSRQVGAYLDGVARYDPKLPERLRGGFVRRYEALRLDGLDGDNLFAALAGWSSAKSGSFDRQAAGRAVLTYLFQVCDVFER